MNIQIPVKWLQELLALCGPEDHELRERVMASITAMNEQAAGPVVTPEPVTTITSIDEHGPCFGWLEHWANFPIGTKLFTEKQLRALLATATGLPAQAVPAFCHVASLKLKSLQERGYQITGYALEKPVEGAQPERGFINHGGFVGWWWDGQSPQAQADARDAEIIWPKARDIGRIGDMSQVAHIRVGFDSDNDVFVSVWDENGGGSIEFCNPGGGGGGQSSRTRMALIALMVAMEADNVEKPSRDWWAQRAAIATAKGEQQS